MIPIYIPSYKRAKALVGAEYFADALFVVPESQRDEYAAEVGANRLVVIPDEHDGSITKKRNWILDNLPAPLVMVDDDVARVGYFDGRIGEKNGDHKKKTLDPALLQRWLESSFAIADGIGAKMWGVAQNEDNRIYKEQLPFSFSKIVLGPFQAHLQHPLRFDPNMGTKDDYDMCLQQLLEYKAVLRWNKFHYICEHGTNAGGIVATRTMQTEEKYCRAIEAKWGTSIIKYRNPARKMADLLNAAHCRVPIKGV